MYIYVKMFDDRLVVESPGGFPDLVNPENIYDMHCSRNLWLMWSMFHLEFVKCAHEGTRRMQDAMLKSNLPAPEFKELESHAPIVRVVLRNNIEHRKAFLDVNAVKIIGESFFESPDETEKMIVNCLAERQTINIADASRVIGRGWQATKRILNELTDRGVLVYVSPLNIDRDPKAHYILKGARANGNVKPR